jgi:N-methylhydantoinase B
VGTPVKNAIIQSGKIEELPGKCALFAEAGSLLRIETPGGGGWGSFGRKHKKRKN